MHNFNSLESDYIIQEREAVAVRDLAMSTLRPIASREISKNNGASKTRGFLVYSDSGENIGSGATDEFFGFVVVKQPARSWKMKISFLEYVLTEEQRYSNYREVYDFECSESLGCTALKKTIAVVVPILSSRTDLKTGTVIDTVQPNRLEDIEPMTTEDCDVLCDKMLKFNKDNLVLSR